MHCSVRVDQHRARQGGVSGFQRQGWVIGGLGGSGPEDAALAPPSPRVVDTWLCLLLALNHLGPELSLPTPRAQADGAAHQDQQPQLPGGHHGRGRPVGPGHQRQLPQGAGGAGCGGHPAGGHQQDRDHAGVCVCLCVCVCVCVCLCVCVCVHVWGEGGEESVYITWHAEQ